MSEQERGWMSQVMERTGDERPYWIVVSGGRLDYTAKRWSPARMQRAVAGR